MECLVCRALSGEKRISPGPTIYDGRYWVVEHAYPTSLKGWLVIDLKRHAEALHELSLEEFRELAEIQHRLAQVMHSYAHSAKEYTMCFSEGQHFEHIHFHFVPRSADIAQELKGFRIFALLNADEQAAVPEAEVRAFCDEFAEKYMHM
ncbi:MAG: HIT domain-containing protein [Chloroflexota bacterium]|nr:HIT domain-containing protein [Chloroflexota bacterium]